MRCLIPYFHFRITERLTERKFGGKLVPGYKSKHRAGLDIRKRNFTRNEPNRTVREIKKWHPYYN